MKKILAVLLAVFMVFAVCACTDNTGENNNGEVVDNDVQNTPDDSQVTPDDSQNTPDDTQNGETPDDTADDDKIVMATNAYFQPYEYYEGDKIVGIDAEIAAAIAEKLGKTLEISDMQFDSILTAVQEGAVDFGMAGMTVNEERLESVDFTISYANGVQAIIVKEGSPIETVDDLYEEGVSYNVGVQLGTTGDTYSTDDFGDERVNRYSNGNEAVLALLGDSIDCVIIDNEPAKALVAANEGLKILETAYADEDYAICVAKGNTELLDQLNAAIVELTADGTIDSIINKYIQ